MSTSTTPTRSFRYDQLQHAHSTTSIANHDNHNNNSTSTAITSIVTSDRKARYSLFPSPESCPSLRASALLAAATSSNKYSDYSKKRDADEAMTASSTTAFTTHDDTINNIINSSPSSIPFNSIPTRTSSTKAVSATNGDHRRHTSSNTNTSPKSQRSVSVRKHKSLVSVPEERRKLPEPGEQEWLRGMAQSRASSSNHNPKLSSSASFSQSGMDKLPPAMISGDLINGTGMSWSGEKENILKGPFDYLESHPGKDIRSQMISAFNEWLQVPDASLQVITKVVSMLHTASLLVDDVEDNSNLRRGIPVAHSIFGTAQTINSANYIYFCALQELLTLGNPEVIRIYTDELLNLHRGQGMDLFWRDTLTCPTEDDYLEMVGNKTGGLFRLAIKLMCCEFPSHNHNFHAPDEPPSVQTDYVPLVNTIGLLFQILDDYKNLSDTTYTNNKGLCEDLTEGKFSFPIIHAIRSDPSNLVLINILKQKTTDDEVKKYAVAYMDRTGSFSYTRRVLRGLTKKALALVDEVDAGRGKSEGIKGILERLRVDKHSRMSVSVGS